MLKRKLPKVVTGVLAIGVWALPATAAMARVEQSKKISETQHIATVATTGTGASFRIISAGIFDGTIGGHPIHGALRAVSKIDSPNTSTVNGTEYDAGGSRSFVLQIHFTISNGQVTDDGSGKWTGGTGSYAHARGSFTIGGSRPVDGASSIDLKGPIAN